MKRIVSLVMVMVMLLSFGSGAFAEVVERYNIKHNSINKNYLSNIGFEVKDYTKLNKFEVNSNDILVEKKETPYGTAYYVKRNIASSINGGNKGIEIQAVSFWDLIDIVMAGQSWADLFKEPSWSNFGWAILDTASLLPLLPSSAYFRKGGKTLLNIDEVAKFAKTSKGKKAVEAAMKFFKFSDAIDSNAIKAINKKWKGKEAEKVLDIFKKAADKGLVGPKSETGIKKLTGTIDKIYTHEIKVLGDYGAFRIYGYQESGVWIFDYFDKAHK